jgi:benzodiazapine receptor
MPDTGVPDRSLGRQVLVFLAFGCAAVVAGVGIWAVVGTQEEYAALVKPSWAPPPWLFGPVWTVLYVMIALSGWLAWRRAASLRILVPYVVQLALNAAWTPIFFGAGQYGWAVVDIVALWLAIVATMWTFRKVSTLATVLLIPYLAWVSFATALNVSIWLAN